MAINKTTKTTKTTMSNRFLYGNRMDIPVLVVLSVLKMQLPSVNSLPKNLKNSVMIRANSRTNTHMNTSALIRTGEYVYYSTHEYTYLDCNHSLRKSRNKEGCLLSFPISESGKSKVDAMKLILGNLLSLFVSTVSPLFYRWENDYLPSFRSHAPILPKQERSHLFLHKGRFMFIPSPCLSSIELKEGKHL